MHRKALRATVGGVDVDVPVGTWTAGQVLTYDGTQITSTPAGSAGIGGSTGATDNAVLRADGVGGATLQTSLVTISDAGSITIPVGQTFGNVTNDAQLKRADNDWGGFTPDLLPQSDTRFIAEVNNGGAWNKRVVPASAFGGPLDIITDSAPLHWWLASNNTQTGGLVDSLNDLGSSPKNFAQAGAARAPIATDGDGLQYLALDGAVDFYQAGAVADWKFLSYINEPLVSRGFTIAMIFNRTVAFTAEEMLLDTCNAASASIGFCIRHMTDGVGAGQAMTGPGFFIGNGAGASSLGMVSRGRPYLTKEVLVIRFSNENGGSGGTLDPGGANAPTAMDGIMRRNGSTRSFTRHGGSADSTTNPSFVLTLGRRASTADRFSAARLYEILMWDYPLSDRQVAAYEERARVVFKISRM